MIPSVCVLDPEAEHKVKVIDPGTTVDGLVATELSPKSERNRKRNARRRRRQKERKKQKCEEGQTPGQALPLTTGNVAVATPRAPSGEMTDSTSAGDQKLGSGIVNNSASGSSSDETEFSSINDNESTDSDPIRSKVGEVKSMPDAPSPSDMTYPTIFSKTNIDEASSTLDDAPFQPPVVTDPPKPATISFKMPNSKAMKTAFNVVRMKYDQESQQDPQQAIIVISKDKNSTEQSSAKVATSPRENDPKTSSSQGNSEPTNTTTLSHSEYRPLPPLPKPLSHTLDSTGWATVDVMDLSYQEHAILNNLSVLRTALASNKAILKHTTARLDQFAAAHPSSVPKHSMDMVATKDRPYVKGWRARWLAPEERALSDLEWVMMRNVAILMDMAQEMHTGVCVSKRYMDVLMAARENESGGEDEKKNTTTDGTGAGDPAMTSYGIEDGRAG